MGDEFKCKASSEEHYYGYAGAFRWAAAVTRALAKDFPFKCHTDVSPEPIFLAS